MTIREVAANLGLKTLSGSEDRNVNGVFVSDMLSDVMAGAQSGNLWVTVQTHKNIVPAANLVDISAVIITNGKSVPQDTIDLAKKHNVAMFSTSMMTFDLVGKLYGLGLATK